MSAELCVPLRVPNRDCLPASPPPPFHPPPSSFSFPFRPLLCAASLSSGYGSDGQEDDCEEGQPGHGDVCAEREAVEDEVGGPVRDERKHLERGQHRVDVCE